jgi:hypothetical protein
MLLKNPVEAGNIFLRAPAIFCPRPALLLWFAALLAALPLRAIRGEEIPDDQGREKNAPGLKNATAGKAKFGPRDVEIELRGESKLRGELAGEADFVLETSFGTLHFPCGEMVYLRRGAAQNPPAAAGDTAAAGDAAAAKKDPGTGKAAQIPAGNDVVEAQKMKARGTLQNDAVTLHSKLGELSFKLADITAIRWLCWGKRKTLELSQATGMRDWVDTGLDTRPDEPVVISCSGEINFFGNASTPNGCPNWNNGGQFLMGAVIGRLGDGESFLIGAEKTWTAEGSQRLYVKIFSDQNMGRGNRISGQYKMTISIGVLAGEKSE